MNVVNTLDNFIQRGLRFVKSKRFGSNDPINTYQASDFGTDFSIPNGWRAIYSDTSNRSEPVIIGFISPIVDNGLNVGDKKLFSTNSAGDTISYHINLRNDGTIEIGGTADNAVGYNSLKTEFEELQGKYNDLITSLSAWTPFAGDGGAALKVSLFTTPPIIASSTADITNTKKTNIKFE